MRERSVDLHENWEPRSSQAALKVFAQAGEEARSVGLLSFSAFFGPEQRG